MPKGVYRRVKSKTDQQRFWGKVQKTDTCWLWKAGTAGGGYGIFWNGFRQMQAHRFSYQLSKGGIAKGLHLDHLCRVRSCVNPDHLEPVTCRENLLRGISIQAINARKTHCKRGHSFIDSNVYRDKKGRRYCRICIKMHARIYYETVIKYKRPALTANN